MIGGDGQHQRRHLADILGVHLGARIQQSLRHFGTARRNRQHERGEVAQRDRAILYRFRFLRADGVHVGAFRQQEFHRLQTAVPRREHQGSPPHAILLVDRRAALQQQPDGRQIIRQRRPDQHIRLQFRPVVQQKPHRRRGAVVSRRQRQRRATHFRFGVDIRSGGHQEADFFRLGDGPHERGGAKIVLRVTSGPAERMVRKASRLP